MTDNSQHDIVIVGGGLVGLALAVACGREGLRVAVIERHASELQLSAEFDGRVSAIAKGSQNLLENIGVWRHAAAQAEPITDIRVSDAGSFFSLHYACAEIGSENFGAIIENRALRAALLTEAAACGTLTLHAPATVASYECDANGVSLTLADGKTFAARLLIGADGKHSRLRKEAGIAAIEAAYKQDAIVCTIEHEKPHRGLAQERFLPVGPFAVLPMQGHRSSLVWTEPRERTQAYLQLPSEDFNQEIRERVGDYLGELRAVGPRYSYPLSLMHATRYTATRLALLGDAAHAIHPIAGQGVNLGYRDVAVLAELLGDAARRGQDIGAPELLSHYERWRRFDNTTMLAVTDGLTHLFSNSLPPIALARRLGMAAVGKMPPLKRFFMRHAMGLVGDVPRLMQKPA